MAAAKHWALLLPAALVCFFLFYNIPKLEEHLAARYGKAFQA